VGVDGHGTNHAEIMSCRQLGHREQVTTTCTLIEPEVRNGDFLNVRGVVA